MGVTQQSFLKELVRKGEGQMVEFKKSLSLQREGLEALCAMVNSDLARGTVIFGVEKDGTVCGIEEGNLVRVTTHRICVIRGLTLFPGYARVFAVMSPMLQKTKVTITTDDLMTVADAAETLGKHIATIYRWVDADRIIGIKLGGILFIPVSEVERLKNKARSEIESQSNTERVND